MKHHGDWRKNTFFPHHAGHDTEIPWQALDIPDIDSQIGLMHTLFALEDIYGLTVSETNGEVCLKVNKDKSKDAAELLKMLSAWKEQADKLSAEEISKPLDSKNNRT